MKRQEPEARAIFGIVRSLHRSAAPLLTEQRRPPALELVDGRLALSMPRANAIFLNSTIAAPFR
jgi:hypothetical protein